MNRLEIRPLRADRETVVRLAEIQGGLVGTAIYYKRLTASGDSGRGRRSAG
jgi:hypothetical protein